MAKFIASCFSAVPAPLNVTSPRGLQLQQLKLSRSCFRLQHRPSHLSIFSPNSFPFQWPPSPIVDASVRLPPLAVQATQALQDVTNPTPFSWPTAAEGSVGLSPPATQACTSQAFPPVTNNPPFSFQWPPAPIADSSPEADLSVRLPSLAIIAHAPLPHSSLLHSKQCHFPDQFPAPLERQDAVGR